MTLASDDRVTSIYKADGVQLQFAYDFPTFYADEDKGIQVRLVTDTSFNVVDKGEYIVVPNTDNTGGYIQFTTAPLSGTQVQIVGKTTVNQQLEIANASRFDPESIETNFDKIVAILQEWLQRLSDEEKLRIANDLALTNRLDTTDKNLATEIANRVQGDINLQNQITSNDVDIAQIKNIISESINNGSSPNLAVFSVNSVSDLDSLKTWENRTVYVKDIGNYIFNNNTWNKTKVQTDITDLPTQELFNKKSVTTVESVADLDNLGIWNGRTVYVKGYYKPTNFALAQPYKGGGVRTYVSSRSNENDGVICINGWVLNVDTEINLYQGGVVGDGVTDDVIAFQNVINSANKIQAKIVGNPSDTYLFKTITNQGGDFNNFITCKTSYLNIDLNKATIKIADNAGDYTSIFHVNWTHTYARITNGTINCNTANNLPQSNVEWHNTKNQRITLNAALVNHKYFEASNLKLQDCSGAWEMLITLSNVINVNWNTIEYSSSKKLNYTDRTSIFIFPQVSAVIRYNNMSGGNLGNAVTAFEVHNSNVDVHNNTVSGYRTSLYIAPNGSDVYSGYDGKLYGNIRVYDNKFLSVQSGIIFWIEDGSKLDRPINNVHIFRNKIYIDSYLLTDSHQVSPGIGIGELGGNYKTDAKNIYIYKNDIDYAWHSEDVGGSDVYTGINFVTRLNYQSIFNYDKWYVQENTVNGSPFNAVNFGCVKGGAKFSNFHINENTLTYCGWAKVASDRSAIKLNNVQGSFFNISGNTASDNGNTDNYMSLFSIDTQLNMSKISNNPFVFSRSANSNEMYQVGGNFIDEQSCVSLTAGGTTIQAKKGSKLALPNGDILVQTASDYTNPSWKVLTY